MAINLSRNTRLFVSTVQATAAASHDATNTWEVPVLDGYSFSQGTDSQTITLDEAGETVTRGQKIFNTALNPVEVSLPTYVRPYYNTTNTKQSCVERVLWEAFVGAGDPTNDHGTSQYGTNAKESTSSSLPFTANFEASNVNELTKLQLFFKIDTSVYLVKDVIFTTAEVDFAIDAISMITWGGSGTEIEEVTLDDWDFTTNTTDFLKSTGIAAGTADTEAKFIRNKLSTIKMIRTSAQAGDAVEAEWTVNYGGGLLDTANHTLAATTAYTADFTIDGGTLQTVTIDTTTWSGTTIGDVITEINYQLDDATVRISGGDLIVTSHTAGTTSIVLVADGGVNALLATLDTVNFTAIGSETTDGADGTGVPKEYNVPITGGSLTLENNVSYLTPEELGKVNKPLPGFTGTRAISGTLTAYLNSGATNTGGLLADLAADTNTVTHDFEMTMFMGGETNATNVKFFMPNCHLVIPTFNVEDVISTEISFTALGSDITQADELYVEYKAATA